VQREGLVDVLYCARNFGGREFGAEDAGWVGTGGGDTRAVRKEIVAQGGEEVEGGDTEGCSGYQSNLARGAHCPP
jgi:hypothetical protein